MNRNAFILAALAGLCSFTSLAPAYFLPGAIVGPALLFLTLRRRPWFAGRLGFVYAAGFLYPQVYWLSEFQTLASHAVVLLSGIMYAAATRSAGPRPFLLAAALTGVELFRSIGIFAFPWGVIGTAVLGGGLERLTPFVGVWGVSFLLYIASFLVAARPRAGFVAIVLGFVIHVTGGLPLPAMSNTSDDSIRIGVVQGNFSPEEDYEFDPARVLDVLFAETKKLSRQGATMVVWTETVILEYLNKDSRVAALITKLAQDEGVDLIVGAPAIDAFNLKRNSAYYFFASGKSPIRYDKHHLVPFGEYVPFVGPDSNHVILPEGVGDFTPSLVPLPLGNVGALICYEGGFPRMARRLVAQGAKLLVVLSNDAWSRSDLQGSQLYDMTRMRALELARPVVRAGNVGISGIIDATGSELARVSSRRRTSIVEVVELPQRLTLAAIYGDWAGWLCLLGVPFFLTIKAADVENTWFDD